MSKPLDTPTADPSEWAHNNALKLAREFRLNPNGMIDNASIRALANFLDETIREGERVAYAKRNL